MTVNSNLKSSYEFLPSLDQQIEPAILGNLCRFRALRSRVSKTRYLL